MSIEVKCKKCHWTKQYPEGTKVENVGMDCPICGDNLRMYAIADWLRGISPGD